jgi:hypothetical protein
LKTSGCVSMGGSCNKCQHRCCINGESGVGVSVDCSSCGSWMQLCSNDLTDSQLEKRSNGEACGCFDRIGMVICKECGGEADNYLCGCCREVDFICYDCQ